MRIRSVFLILLVCLSSACNRRGEKVTAGSDGHQSALSTEHNDIKDVLQNSEELRAISLKATQAAIQEERGSVPQDILHLFGLSKLVGYILDEDQDIILFGESLESAPQLYLDDFVVALRNAWQLYVVKKDNKLYYSSPGCSIDPSPGVIGELMQIGKKMRLSSDQDNIQSELEKWRNICVHPQQVRVMGIPSDTRFAKVMVDADYYMKKIADGSVNLQIDGFQGFMDLRMSSIQNHLQHGQEANLAFNSLNRFWFFPGENSFLTDDGIVLINQCSVTLLTEEEYLTTTNHIAGTGNTDSLAQLFVRMFTEKYQEIANKISLYAELEELFRMVTLANIMKMKDSTADIERQLHYFLYDYPVKSTFVPVSLPGRSNIKQMSHRSKSEDGFIGHYLWLPSCGGVSIAVDIEKSNIQKISKNNKIKLQNIILDSRPSNNSLFWNFSLR